MSICRESRLYAMGLGCWGYKTHESIEWVDRYLNAIKKDEFGWHVIISILGVISILNRLKIIGIKL